MSVLLIGSIIIEHQEQSANQPFPVSTRPASAAPGGAAYTIFDLGTGNGNWSSADHINEQGQILLTTGTANDPLSWAVRDQRFWIWHGGTTTDLTSLGAGYPIAINDYGMVLMGDNVNGGHLYQSVSGVLSALPGFETDAYPAGINNAGSVVGQVGSNGVIADRLSMVTIPIPAGFGFAGPAAINEAGDVVGVARFSRSNDSVQRAFIFANSVVTVLGPAPGAKSSRATDLNDNGQVLGDPAMIGAHAEPDPGRAFIDDRASATTIDLGTLPNYTSSMANAINNAGQVVGIAFAAEDATMPVRTPFLYDSRTQEMTDLNQLIPDESGWQLMDALDINDAGQIVGRGLVGGEMHAFLLTPIP